VPKDELLPTEPFAFEAPPVEAPPTVTETVEAKSDI
jgi:hypothetical protein